MVEWWEQRNPVRLRIDMAKVIYPSDMHPRNKKGYIYIPSVLFIHVKLTLCKYSSSQPNKPMPST